jgi:hypothetical protein
MEQENVNNKYKNGKIYKITDNNFTKVYYGSTVQPLSKRMVQHRTDYTLKKNNCSSHMLFDEFGIDNCQIILVEKATCNDKEELRRLEGGYIQNNECVNKRIAGRTDKEYSKYYKEKNREKVREQHKKYRIENADKLKEKERQYALNNPDKIKAKGKKYREENKEKVSAKDKEYREKNKERIAQMKARIIDCECGESYTASCKYRHIKKQCHLDYLAKQIEI